MSFTELIKQNGVDTDMVFLLTEAGKRLLIYEAGGASWIIASTTPEVPLDSSLLLEEDLQLVEMTAAKADAFHARHDPLGTQVDIIALNHEGTTLLQALTDLGQTICFQFTLAGSLGTKAGPIAKA